MTTKEAPLNLYPDQVPSIRLKDLIDSNVDIYTFCSNGKKPLLITDVYEVFPEMAKWSPEFLREKVGNKVINVNTSKTDVFQEYQAQHGEFVLGGRHSAAQLVGRIPQQLLEFCFGHAMFSPCGAAGFFE